MSSSSTISALLSMEKKPGQSFYSGAVNSVVNDPEQIRRLTEGDAKGETLIHLTTRGYRLARFFSRLHRFVRADPSSSTTFHLADETATFLTLILQDLDQLLEPTKELEFIVPALEVCFAPSQPPALRKLALVLGGCGTLLEHLTSDRSGSIIVRQWAYLPSNLALDAGTQEVWTGRLVNMVSSCQGYHDIAPSIRQWATLIALKRTLQSFEARLLDDEDKRTSLPRGQETNSPFFPLEDDLKGMLRTFDMAEPESRRMVQSHIETLKSSKIPAIFRSIATSFPCKRCIPALGSTPRSTNTEIHDQSIAVIPNLPIDILGKAVGVWKVLLSGPALKSIQKLSRLGLFSPVRAKLTDLASGCWKSRLADQKERVKVPVFKTKCGQDISILWQVYTGIAGDMELPQQVLVVWEVGNPDATSKALDRVIHLQGGYTDEIIRRCRQRHPHLNGKHIPAHFENLTLQSARPEKSSAAFDVRTVDQDTIDLANKFYALTEPVIRSILDNDLAAEFPFDLSQEEARVITHFQTASLVLGRSGTGKTTCLIFKLVGKFLASKAILDERPVRQVLLTRSSFLAEKLSIYTRRLIETLLSKSRTSESFEAEEYLLSRTIEEDFDSNSVLTLRDQSFPLICTFERFLQILENTIIELDRQNFYDLGDLPSHQIHKVPKTKSAHQRQTVDFYAFKLDYWSRLPQYLTKDLSVNLVFAEIMGVIKGSVSSRKSLAPISQDEYLTRSCRMAPTFVSEAERLCVYDIFRLYEKLKIEWGDVDYIDRVVRILKAVRRDPSLNQLLRSTFDEVYIDEIQDQRCLDIELFLGFLKDGRGFHLAGDTAQAISHDSNFRFSDIKRLFHEHFAGTSASTKQSDLSEPQMFTLSKNYRSHQGILALASLVMGMIWKGFPETIDKLYPEVGNLSGPKPVLFLDCGIEILNSCNVGSSKFSERAADFGAEQVIIVRDTRSKKVLQDQVGDVALILTILESKGMEFDDVILWNFFSECPDQAGVRSLNALKNDVDGFDPRKHGGMCSELKQFYVAITRARSQLSIVESSELTATPVLKLLTQGSSGPLVEVTRPNHESFAVRVEMLRPRTSVDPTTWLPRADEFMRQRLYTDALMAFRRAGDTQGEIRAQGFLKEEDGKLCHNDIEGFTRNMRIAIEYFLKVNLVGDAVRVLMTLGELGEAAEMWFQYREYTRAAPLFADAGLYAKAAECHHRLRHHSEAAASLRQGSHYNQLVSYVDEHSQNIPSDALRGYSLLCKLLLKQKKISPEHRKHAIRLLGSLDEQEACFLEYGMDEQLADLYINQKRHKDLYDLFSRTGQLERALDLGLSKDLFRSAAGIPESEILKLLDYVWAGKMVKKCQQNFAAAFTLRSDYLTPKIIHRIEQWEASHRMYNYKGFNVHPKLANMEDTIAKKILILQKITDTRTVPQIPKLDDMPIEMMQQAVGIAKDLVLKNDRHAQSVIYILTGIWTINGPQERSLLLPWSPFYGTMTAFGTTDISEVAKKWFLDKIASTVLALDSRARVLWNSKWQVRCARYLTTGICKLHNCQRVHEHLSQDDCSRILEDMLRVNYLFCDLAMLYYRRVMSTIFQQKYLGIRRHWLERLLRELTFLSATEQSASAITKTQMELLQGNKFLVVRSSLEELLYFRLGKEWRERSDFTALLEQMQIAEAFGSTVRSGLFQALSHKLQLDHRNSTQRHLGLLNMLKLYPDRQSASIFRNNLETFLHDLDHHNVRTFASLHSFTTVCESLATYVILKTCVTACVLTKSWVDLYRPSMNMAAQSPEPLEWEDRYRYQQCLIELVKAFCRILRRLNESPLKITLSCSGKPHEALPLQRRNAEFVAILTANVAATSRVPAQVWTGAEVVFSSDIVRAIQRQIATPGQILTPGELIPKLAPQLLTHNSKNALVVIAKVHRKGLVFSNLESYAGVKTFLFDQLCPRTAIAADADVAVGPSLANSNDSPQGEYPQAEKDAVAKIKQLWLSCSPKIKRRRSYTSVPECRAIARLFNMGAQCAATMIFRDRTSIRKLLVLQGVSLSVRIATAGESLSRLQKDTMACVENVEVSVGVFESVDVVLGRNREAESLLKSAEGKMSDECLAGLVKLGVLSTLEKAMEDVEGILAEAEQVMLKTRKILDAVV